MREIKIPKEILRIWFKEMCTQKSNEEIFIRFSMYFKNKKEMVDYYQSLIEKIEDS